jgi:hypothetical protein
VPRRMANEPLDAMVSLVSRCGGSCNSKADQKRERERERERTKHLLDYEISSAFAARQAKSNKSSRTLLLLMVCGSP